MFLLENKNNSKNIQRMNVNNNKVIPEKHPLYVDPQLKVKKTELTTKDNLNINIIIYSKNPK